MRRPCPKACWGSMLKKDDLKEMAGRFRLIARTADKFTRIRLLELASKYEAQLEKPISTCQQRPRSPTPRRR